MTTDRIYLDYNATTPLRPEVLTLMRNILEETGNASSSHSFGRAARARVEKGREQLAALTGTHPNQVTFTCGATESNNTVMQAFKGRRILASAIEHRAALGPAPDAEIIPVTSDGIIDMESFEKLLNESEPPDLICVMLVNNETGAIQPVEDIARMAKKIHPDVFIHTDAVQAAGRIKIDMPALQVDYMSLSAHKVGGPQGVGALIAAPGAKPVKLFHGGSQEKHQRAGTENVAGIAGFGMAAERAVSDMDRYRKLAILRDDMEKELHKIEPDLRIFSKNAPRVANTSNINLTGMPAKTQLIKLDLDGIAASGGSACASGAGKPSHVLAAMGATEEESSSSLRISMGWNTKKSDIDRFIEAWSKMHGHIKRKENGQNT